MTEVLLAKARSIAERTGETNLRDVNVTAGITIIAGDDR
jgi:hypothetical protein